MSGIARVTQRSMSDVALRGLQEALSRTQRLQEELSSGRRVSRPGDDPAAAVAAMKLRSHRQADEQYLRNAHDASGRLAAADKALTTTSERLTRARELIVQSQNGAISDSGRQALGSEIAAIRDDVIDLLNTRWLDRPVFGGTIPGTDAVDKSTGAYIGDDAEILSRISRDATIRVDVRGTDIGADVLPGLLASAAEHVAAGSGDVPADLTALDDAITTVLRALGDVGARASRIETTKTKVDSERLDLTARISENEDVDLPETIMNLESQKVAYQAALGAAAKVLQVSLSDYLR
jgi:flagellar hook-associated protein 3 FlgL